MWLHVACHRAGVQAMEEGDTGCTTGKLIHHQPLTVFMVISDQNCWS